LFLAFQGKVSTMIAPNEFWLGLYTLAETHDDEGMSPSERIANIVNQLRELPPLAQREYLFALERVADDLRILRPLVVAAINEAEPTVRVRIMSNQGAV
jgi:hypothetical protein